jgi:hypothetical protein
VTLTVKKQQRNVAILGLPDPFILSRENLESLMMTIDDFICEKTANNQCDIEVGSNVSVLHKKRNRKSRV